MTAVFVGCLVRNKCNGQLYKVVRVYPNRIVLSDRVDGTDNYSIPRKEMASRFSLHEAFHGFNSINEYALNFQEGCTVECIHHSGKYYRKGQTFEVMAVRFDEGSPKFRAKGRGWFTVSNFKVLGGPMKNIPSTKFYCVASEKANSPRRYFDGQGDPVQAEKDATAHAEELIREGVTGVAILEAKKVIRPKVAVDVTTY